MSRRALVAALLVGGAAAASGGPAAAQEPEADPARADTVRANTLRADTLAADTTEAAADTAGLPDVEARREALASGDFPERDSLFRRLFEAPGFRAVEYRGERVELDVDREAVRLEGRAQANYATSALEADTIDYRIALQFIEARGGIRLAAEGQREVTSETALYYDVSRFRGTILDARTAFAERGAEWYVRGTATPRGDDRVFVERGSFTSCELEAPHYYFRAGQMKVVSQNVIVAWPVVLYIHDVPVAWLPFFAQDIRPGRRSGFLPPRFGVNDIVRPSSGFERTISDFGYYLAISPFLDAQATIDWFSGSYTRLNGAFRYRILKRFIRGNFMTSYSFGPAGRSFEFRGNHDQQLSPVTDLRVRAAFVQNTRLHQDRDFDPNRQTQTIDSDFGLNHRFPFANASLSGSRRQFLGAQAGRTDLTLPRLNVSFSPVTLFPAPPGQAGMFENVTWTGSLNLTRTARTEEVRDDVTDTRGSANQSLRFGDVTLSTNASLDDRHTAPVDTLDLGLESTRRTILGYGGSLSYQVDLVGSTVLRPSLSFDGSAFRSPDTDDEFIAAPGRLSLGASLSTDLFGFYPGFGAFSRVRHKVSPRFSYAYSPEVTVPEDRLEIPGFPAAAARERNTLSISLSQTFEAKVRREADPRLRDADAAPDTTGMDDVERAGITPDETLGVEREDTPQVEEALPPEPGPPDPEGEDETVPPLAPGDTVPATGEAPLGRDTTFAQPAPEERVVTLLSINTTPLELDLTRSDGGPLLVTDRLGNTLNSDLLRGFSLRVTHDLFEGSGAERRFRPFLAEVSTGVNFSSAQGLGGLFGLGDGSGAQAAPQPVQEVDSRYRLSGFDEAEDDFEPEAARAGPWTLNLSYTLQRSRADELLGTEGSESQSLQTMLSLQPTPGWRLRWQTLYNLTDGEFGRHLLSLDRDLHRWQASFVLTRAPNGNVLFQIRVFLRDAPELKVDYDQRAQIEN